LRYKFSRLRLEGYDGYVIFGSHSIAAARKHHPNVLWSTRPLAYLYGWDGEGPDENTRYLYGKGTFRKIAVGIYMRLLRIIDQIQIRNVDKIRTVGILAENALRAAYPNKDIGILYAPIDISQYKYLKKGGYYVNVARHVPDKHVERIVEAFKMMPDKELYQIGQGDDSIAKLARGYKNIKILGFRSEGELRKLIGESIAMISASEGEDFSMNLMESLASGKPTISVNLDRTIKKAVIAETGMLMPNSQPNEVVKAVKFLDSDRADKMKNACEKKSKLFSKEKYLSGLLEALGIDNS
ncbi:MAG: glycosyltransferase, partial [Nanoarchaeota archaeon]